MPADPYAEGLALLDERRNDEALARFDAALAQTPGHPGARIERAYLVLEKRDWSAALAEMVEAKKAASAALGELSRWKGRFWTDEATRPYVRAVHGIGVCHMKRGERDLAAEAFREVLDRCPADPTGAKFLLGDVQRGAGDAKGKGARR